MTRPAQAAQAWRRVYDQRPAVKARKRTYRSPAAVAARRLARVSTSVRASLAVLGVSRFELGVEAQDLDPFVVPLWRELRRLPVRAHATPTNPGSARYEELMGLIAARTQEIAAKAARQGDDHG